ncbi:MAG: alpha/beta fold hydrolase [Acidimicrobiales bacterium]
MKTTLPISPTPPEGWVRHHYDSSDGLELCYYDTASGNLSGNLPVVVALHGFAADSVVTWGRASIASRLLGSGYRFVAVDLRGHGCSATPDNLDAYSMDLLVDDIRRLVRAIGAEQAVLFGYSLGGVISVCATRIPGVRGIIAGGVGDVLLRGDRFAGSQLLAGAMDAPDIMSVPDRRARAYRRFAEATGANLPALAALQRGLSGGVAMDFASIEVPVLFIAGKDDPVAGNPEPLAGKVRRGVATQVPGNHMNALLNSEFASKVMDYLKSIG